MSIPDLETIRERVIACRRCPRLRAYCTRVAKEKKAAYRHETYWGLPVPGFGDPHARLFIVGLAPAAHGGNRTGRVFTGDSSGDFLFAALHRAGLANQPTSRDVNDGLALRGAYIAAAARCAPPENKPTRQEMDNCFPYLRDELSALPDARVLVALGRIAFDACLRLLAERGAALKPRPPFVHARTDTFGPGLPALVASYHPSRQNTNTGKLTPAMFDRVFAEALRLIT